MVLSNNFNISLGYFILAERLRSEELKLSVASVLEKFCGCDIVPSHYYTVFRDNDENSNPAPDSKSLYPRKENCVELLELIDLRSKLRTGEISADGIPSIALTESLCRLWVIRCMYFLLHL
jgi:hypothetical protein